MTSALEQSFKKRLQLIAKERNITPSEVWQNVITERFLVRLCRSPYHSHFVLKGGMLLARYIDIGRETKDLDFAIQRLSNEINALQKTFNDIVCVDMEDGFAFMNPVVAPLEHFHMEYPGAHIKIEVRFGKSKFPLFIDLGFGDLVQAYEKELLLLSNSKGPLFESSLTINCYPMEFVFAEKLETAIFRGADNSRMKDFHDLYTIASSDKMLNGEDTARAIRLVFGHRKTPLLLPIQFNSTALETLQKHWGRYHQTAMASARLPNRIVDVIDVINKIFLILCLLPLMGFAEQEGVPLCFEGIVSSRDCERHRKEASFETTGPVHVECSYPVFSGKGILIEQVNRQLKTEVEGRFNCFIQGEMCTEEVWEDGCTLSYELFPIYQAPNLISIYGCDFQGRGCHGCTYYEGKTFWQRGGSVVKLVLDDLFIKESGYRRFLIQYCENYFKSSGYGYYSSRSELLPELSPGDLDIFVPTDKELMIIFRAYTVGGWADGPDIVLIPYAELKKFIDPFGPLKGIYE